LNCCVDASFSVALIGLIAKAGPAATISTTLAV
jgi:hypothetical protein